MILLEDRGIRGQTDKKADGQQIGKGGIKEEAVGIRLEDNPCLFKTCQRVGLQAATLISDEEEGLGEEELTPSSTPFLCPLLASITLSQQICQGHATRSINWINKDVRH